MIQGVHALITISRLWPWPDTAFCASAYETMLPALPSAAIITVLGFQ